MKKQLLLLTLLLTASLITGCNEGNNSLSNSEPNVSSTEPNGGGTSNSSTSSSTSDSSSSSNNDNEETKTIRITSDNFNSLSYLSYSNVEKNTKYDEITFNSLGYITSSSIKGITKIISKCYSTYDNMALYNGTSSKGTLCTPSSSQIEDTTKIYTYIFSSPIDSFYYVNSSTSNRHHIYYIDIYYTDDIDNNTPNGGSTSSHTYTDFTTEEKSLFNSVVDTVIPFAPCDDYEIEEYNEDGYIGIRGDFIGLTNNEFISYKNSLTYTYYEEYEDEYGDTWYLYDITETLYFDICYYTYDNENYLMFDVYYYTGDDGDDDTSGSVWDSVTINNIYTNEGKGISSLINDKGYTDVNFADNTKVKDVTEQTSYKDGCPTTGNVNVLVVPVDFKDNNKTQPDLKALDLALNGGEGEENLTYGMSVSTYFNKSSYEKLNLNFDIMGGGTKWYTTSNSSSYYINQDISAGNDSTTDVDIFEEIMSSYSNEVDFTKYNADNNETIDAVMIIPNIAISTEDDASILQWAYRYWSYSETKFDGLYLNDYLWCPYDFLFETDSGYDNGDTPTNNYTLIHEFGHILGADDYYDASDSNTETLLDGDDVMDAKFGDHNPFTKFNYGWLTTSKLISAEESVTLDLEAFEKSGDSIIVANNWDSTLGCYQEYWVLMYYTKENVNAKSNYSFKEGIVAYHINAQLIDYTYSYYNYIDIYTTNNQSSSYNTGVNLIELVELSSSGYSLQVGETSYSTIKDDNEQKISYTFTLNSINDGKANITFTSNN